MMKIDKRIKIIGMVAIGILLYDYISQNFIVPAAIKFAMKRKIALKKGWEMRGIWSAIPFALIDKFYIFNITNSEAIAKGEKPIVEEVGPYSYYKWHRKVNQMDHDEDDTVSFNMNDLYYFNKSESKPLTGNEEVIVPNYFLLTLVNTVLRTRPSFMPIMNKAANSLFKNPTSMFIKAKVKDILFNGLMVDCNVSDTAGNAVCNEVREKYEQFHLDRVSENLFGFSFFGWMNGTDSKRMRVKRGYKNITEVGVVVEYDGKSNISVWDDEYCDTFRGTDSTIYHPNFDKDGNDNVVAFAPAICRSLVMKFEKKSNYKGIRTLRYKTRVDIDPEKNHECYCKPPSVCMKKGTYDLYRCIQAPVYLSNPHFFRADPSYFDMVEGLNPDKDKHATFLEHDAFTGGPVQAFVRIQFNMLITKIEKFKLMKNYPTAVLPLFWFEEIALPPWYLIKPIKLAQTGLLLNRLMGLALALVGVLGLLVVFGYIAFKLYKSNFPTTTTNVNKSNNNNNNNKPRSPSNQSTRPSSAEIQTSEVQTAQVQTTEIQVFKNLRPAKLPMSVD